MSDSIARLLGPEGPIAELHPDYEHRPGQVRMAEAVKEAFGEQEILLVEAGTGTGKSLAYLLPAVQEALENDDRVVVSTHTIALQEQLIRKDIPFLQRALDLDFEAVLVKGRTNYVSKRRLEEQLSEPELFEEFGERAELKAIKRGIERSEHGSRHELDQLPHFSIWSKVQSESDNCLKSDCRHFKECYFFRARRRMGEAQILVVNHHLLFADLALRQETDGGQAVLPEYQHVIVDEAHHLEDVAASYFGMSLSRYGLGRMLGRLCSKRRGRTRGLLPALEKKLPDMAGRASETDPCYRGYRIIAEELRPQVAALEQELEDRFEGIRQAMDQEAEGRRSSRWSDDSDSEDRTLRLRPEHRKTVWFRLLDAEVGQLGESVAQLSVSVNKLLGVLEQTPEETQGKLQGLITEVTAQQGRLLGYSQGLATFLEVGDRTQVRWLELRSRSGREPQVHLNSAPFEVGPTLEKALFEPLSTVVMSSATLTVSRRFDFFRGRLGLVDSPSAERVRELQVGSPFDYARNSRLLLPQRGPDPRDREFPAWLSDVCRDAVLSTGGGAFLLFTSYRLLNQVHEELERDLVGADLLVLRQGERPRHKLLEEFREHGRAVLFGTDSFWEGVDVAGQALRLVVITRLPFRVPTEPLTEARADAIKERGGSPFMELSLPQAVIRLKQGFGRLIRHREDTGAVMILDNRVLTKRYGGIFLRSLPPATRLVAPELRLYQELELIRPAAGATP